MAQSQLDAPIQRHSIVPRRRSRRVSFLFEDQDDGHNDDASKSDVEASPFDQVLDASRYLVNTCPVPNHGKNISTLTTTTPNSASDLHTLVRRASQEFGTTSIRPRRAPSLPFVPPFLKDRARDLTGQKSQ
jgi:hypothetical protein